MLLNMHAHQTHLGIVRGLWCRLAANLPPFRLAAINRLRRVAVHSDPHITAALAEGGAPIGAACRICDGLAPGSAKVSTVATKATTVSTAVTPAKATTVSTAVAAAKSTTCWYGQQQKFQP